MSTSVNKQTTKSLTAIQSFFDKCEYTLSSKETFNTQAVSLTIQQEIGMYISSIDQNTDFQQYWSNHHYQLPKLAHLVRLFGIMAATSVPSESAFSIAGYIHRKQRSSLSPSALRYSMVLRQSDVATMMTIEGEKCRD